MHRLVAPGMVVRTDTDAIRASRKMTIEFLLSEHRVACTTCDADGDCLLQDYAYEYGAAEQRFPAVMPSEVEGVYTIGHKALFTTRRNACAASGA